MDIPLDFCLKVKCYKGVRMERRLTNHQNCTFCDKSYLELIIIPFFSRVVQRGVLEITQPRNDQKTCPAGIMQQANLSMFFV